jgi:aspartyl-tRNA(Asn)/glutamyl-tRNA(Gln) amidotransferase subunit B
VEIKNLNSMRTAIKCVEHEFARQSAMVARGETVLPETRLWNDETSSTRAMRNKEVANDYRYFPDPDLVEMHITPEWQEEVRAHLPELQEAKRRRFQDDYGLPEYDAKVLTASKPVASYFERAVSAHKNPKSLSNWMMTELLRELKEQEIEPDDVPLKAEGLASIVKMIDEGKINGKTGKDVFARAMQGQGTPESIVEKEGLLQVSDTGEIEAFVDEAIAANPDIVAKIQAGQTKSIQALVGQIMKKSRGKANPALVNELLAKKLGT